MVIQNNVLNVQISYRGSFTEPFHWLLGSSELDLPLFHDSSLGILHGGPVSMVSQHPVVQAPCISGRWRQAGRPAWALTNLQFSFNYKLLLEADLMGAFCVWTSGPPWSEFLQLSSLSGVCELWVKNYTKNDICRTRVLATIALPWGHIGQSLIRMD